MKKTKVLTIHNNKGGVTKTFSSMQIGAILAARGYNVLLIDNDDQGNLSKNFGLKELDKLSLAEVILGKCDIHEALKGTYRENLYLISADERLKDAEDVIKHDNRRNDNRLQKALKPLIDEEAFDFIIIDNAPSISTLLINSLTASDSVIIPVEADANSLEGYSLISQKIQDVKEDSNSSLEVLGIVITKVESTNLDKDYVSEVKEAFGELVFSTIIPKSVIAKEAIFEKMALIDYSKKHKLTEAYDELTTEILNRIA